MKKSKAQIAQCRTTLPISGSQGSGMQTRMERWMRRLSAMTLSIALTAAVSLANPVPRVIVTSGGWTVTADRDQRELTVSRQRLGTVLERIELNQRGEHGLQRLQRWSAVEKQQENLLCIHTSDPLTTWVFELNSEDLKISTTGAHGVLTGETPAAAGRIAARLIDLQGTPVNWTMTTEVQKGYKGGFQASTPSFLPRRNPDVMYFALGQVVTSNMHSLFDRKSDIAIDFPEQTLMRRQKSNADVVDLSIEVGGDTRVRIIPEYFTRVLGVPYYVPFDDSYFHQAPMVWDSWSSYYSHVREEDIVRNTDWLAKNLEAYGFQYVQLDDGYDRGKNGEHYWIEKWNHEKFPDGPKWLTSYIKSKGLLPGIWLVPNAYAGAVDQHPDWYLRFKKNEKIILDYGTPTLDSTNPEVLAFLDKEFAVLDNLGFEYYKFDGEHDFLKYVPGVDLGKIANSSVDPLVAYRHRLQVIRDTVGPHRFIEGCPAGTPLNGIGYFNSYFTGDDPFNSWRGMYAVFSSIDANAFLNHMVTYVQPGEMDVEPLMSVAEAAARRPAEVIDTAHFLEEPLTGFGMTLAEARTVVSHVALSGTVYSLGSPMAELPEERVNLLKLTLPTMPIVPIDLFSRGTAMSLWDPHMRTIPDPNVKARNRPKIIDLKVNAASGVYDVAALTNWRSAATTVDLEFSDKLGLSPDDKYLVFDFWKQEFLGAFRGHIDVSIEPHDTRVLFIHPLLNRPQLVGISRHITGAYSISDLVWDDTKKQLRGKSDTVAGDEYALWIYVPTGLEMVRTRAMSKGQNEIPVHQRFWANALMVRFPGQKDPVNWTIDFSGKSTQ